jgi:hypothetical protein
MTMLTFEIHLFKVTLLRDKVIIEELGVSKALQSAVHIASYINM